MSDSPTGQKVQTFLQQLRDNPSDEEEYHTERMETIYKYLVSIPSDPNDSRLHWFCDKADALTREAATYLLRLHAYTQNSVNVWRERYQLCLSACCECVLGAENAKAESMNTYFAAYSAEKREQFVENFGRWELGRVLEDLCGAGILQNVNNPANLTGRPLSTVRPALIYRMICNLVIFRDPRILEIIKSTPPTDPFPTWPHDPPPVGVFILMANEIDLVREWANRQAALSKIVPISFPLFYEHYQRALEAVVYAFSPNEISTKPDDDDVLVNLGTQCAFATDSSVLWPSLYNIMRVVPTEYYHSRSRFGVDLRRLVISHLHDVGSEFHDVLCCFVLLLQRLNHKLWLGEQPGYPQVVFDSIKDNPSFTALVQANATSKDIHWSLGCFSWFLSSLKDSSAYADVLAKMIDFLCEELQHERFSEIRPNVMTCAAKLLKSHVKRQETDGQAMSHAIDIHSDILVNVAFSRSYDTPQWSVARQSTRELISIILSNDIQNTSLAIDKLCQFTAQALRSESSKAYETVVKPLIIQKRLWTKTLEAFQVNDSDAVSIILSIISPCSLLDILIEKAYIPSKPQITPFSKKMQKTIQDINASLSTMTKGFSGAITTFTEFNTSTAALDVLQRPNVAKAVLKLMLSPVGEVQLAAQSLVGLAFDVDVRLDCFRALLENLPDTALDGIFEFLETFIQLASKVPEACSLSKSLVRGFTDIIEVLCATPDGLLHSPHFLRSTDHKGPAARLPELWTQMNKSIVVIFKRTSAWSKFYSTADMTVWMRDALIFGRDMLAQRRVIEGAANSRSGADPSKKRKLTAIGRKMIEGLQETVLELTRWLRLTDEELLHQSFALLESLLDCFRDNRIRPSKEVFDKLTKHVSDARDPAQLQSRLDSSRANKLEAAVASFDQEEREEQDDDIEIVSVHLAPKEKKRKDTAKPPKIAKVAEQHSRKVSKALSVSQPSQKTATKTTPSRFFSDHDRLKLKATSSALPSFRRTQQPVAGPSKTPSTAKSALPFKDERRSVATTDDDSDSSDSPASDNEGESQANLASLSKMQKSPKIRKTSHRRQIKQIDYPSINPVQARLRREREDALRTARRMRPNLAGLHRAILSWDYEYTGEDIPGHSLPCVQIPQYFQNYAHYRQVFEPLLLLECWGQIKSSKNEPQEAYECKISSRSYQDDWLDLEINVTGYVKKEKGDWYLAETDLVLLQHPDGQRSALGKVLTFKSSPMGTYTSIRCHFPPHKAEPGLAFGSTWRLSKVMNLSTLHREYGALVSAEYYDYLDLVLQRKIVVPKTSDSDTVRQTMKRYNVNEPQARAICSSLEGDGFALIQGPPGTGKTSTICGLVVASLSQRANAPVNVVPGRTNTSSTEKQPKILLCAPSNAAIDEIAKRIKDTSVRKVPVSVVRVGAPTAINSSVQEISLDNLVDNKLGSTQQNKDVGNEMANIRQQLETVKQRRQQVLMEVSNLQGSSDPSGDALKNQLGRLNDERTKLSRRFDDLKDKQKSDLRSLDAARRKARVDILQDADVICSTLSGAGHELLENCDYDMIIIDEAAQAIELSSLIPLRYRCKRCVMVGDPAQLPPTVISKVAERFGYNESLFVRLQRQHPEAVHLLSIQYRMHPDISRLPSNLFYRGLLQDGPMMESKTARPWHIHPKFGTYRFFDVLGNHDKVGQSVKNTAECQAAAALYARLLRQFSGVDFDFKIGIVTMYRAQLTELRRIFQTRFGRDVLKVVDFNTVDGFQGQEKDIIILSCVRAGPGVTDVGFLKDTRRMNVALTRAKSSMFILGNAATLERSDDIWRQIVADARSRNSLIRANADYFSSVSNEVSLPPQPLPSQFRNQHESQPQQQAPLPVDLRTPQSFKTVVNPPSTSLLPVQDSQATAPVPLHVTKSTSLKRPRDVAEELPSTSAALPPKPSKPLAKRQKGPASIFLPSKRPNKGKDQGPPQNRRKL